MDTKPFISNLNKRLDDKVKDIQDQLNKEYSNILEAKRKALEDIKRKALKELPK
ncbi:hypothetical protein [Metallosphaera hakonensis]|uniref:hypothetical protein n=1 Tax=Metallosphaera hakonensis TaxID=79601 RepID=UPI0006D2935E|nr:hypothetical protein [Metallosphaera hakonensis]